MQMNFRKVIHQNAYNEPCKQSLLGISPLGSKMILFSQ